ncbi:esterase-like activity of phytase family protein [Streptomyces sp. SID13031]|uniref:esterase-like activity of phytase family protein n=1 Tax=Streptomyces sp. SID13031 TaxID=2706046 RepID=UPI0013C91B29|nr:esterase-like activity of phytase family protein [Streptomyces sp. SID13031]NEA34704.1 esterase-like activity of phytase family protein [Streptomyces sp. SID13031]
MRWQTPLAAAAVLAALTTSLSAAAAAPVPTGADGGSGDSAGKCSPDARFLGFSDSLDKTTYDGLSVGGLSAISLNGPKHALALVDNVGTTPARVFGLQLGDDHGKPEVAVDSVTILRRPDGTPYTGQDFDGEGLVTELGGTTVLATSEREPSIRRFSLADGKQLASLPVPSRFQVAPAGEASTNATFESLAISTNGNTLYAGMEGPLASDGTDAQGRTRNRILQYAGRPGGAYAVARQLAYKPDPGLALVELAYVHRDQLVSMERTFTPGVGNTIRVFSVSLSGAKDVSTQASLADAPDTVFLKKKLLFDLVNCPPSGAVAKQPQPNPLLDNVEGLALGGFLADGRRQLYLLSDDNNGATQITRLYSLAVNLH